MLKLLVIRQVCSTSKVRCSEYYGSPIFCEPTLVICIFYGCVINMYIFCVRRFWNLGWSRLSTSLVVLEFWKLEFLVDLSRTLACFLDNFLLVRVFDINLINSLFWSKALLYEMSLFYAKVFFKNESSNLCFLFEWPHFLER